MKPSHRSGRIAAACAAFIPLAVTAAIPGVETFDADTAGFVPNTTSSTVIHLAAGGNPGGFIQTRKDLSPPVFDIGALTARPEFSGNYAAGGINGASVDLNFFTANIDDAWIRFRPDVLNNGWRHPLTAAFPTDVWNTYAVAFDPAWSDVDAHANGWLTDQEVDPAALPSPSFAAVMASVDFAEVRIGSVGSTLVGIDNFRLQGGAAVPDSSSRALEGLALVALLVAGRLYAPSRERC